MFPTFAGSPVQPSTVSYEAIALSTDLDLVWPSFALTGDTVAALIMNVTPAGAGLSIAMPDASQVGTGTAALFRNLGSDTFTITDTSGNTIGTVAAGISIYLYLTDNTTADGSWSLVTFGAGTSSADAAALAGYGLKAISTTLNQAHVCVEIATAITISSASRATEYSATGGSVACNLPTAASVGDDFFFIIRNAGSGTVTLTPSGGDTVDGAATLGLNPGDACFVFSSGNTNHWYTVGLGRSVIFAFTQLVKSVAGNTDVTLTASEAANKLISLTGVLTGNINVIVPNTASVYYIYNETTGPYTVTIKTAAGTGAAVAQGTHDIFVCDSVNVYGAITNTITTTAFSAGSAGSPSITFVGDTSTGLYHPTTGQMAFTSGGTQVLLFTSYGIAVSGGTVVVSSPPLSATQTWNAVGVTFTGIKLNITDTTSAAGSLLQDLQVGGVSQWNVSKAGAVTQLGALGIGQAPSAGVAVSIGGSTFTASGNSLYGELNAITYPAAATSIGIGYAAIPATAAAAFVMTEFRDINIAPGTLGAGSAVTTRTGVFVNDWTSGMTATNNRAFRGALPAGANNFNLYMDGTAQNFLAGTLKVGSTIGVGAATPAASGAGITFPASQSASSDANTLDDYEEGTWTSGLSFGAGTTGITYAANGQVGTYTKIGRFCNVSYKTALSSKGSSTGIARTTGLPFTPASLSGQYPWLGAINWASMTTALLNVQAKEVDGDATLRLFGIAAANVSLATQLADTDFANNTAINGTVAFEV